MKLTPREPLVIGTAPATDHEGGTVLTNSDARKGQIAMEETTLPAVLATEAEPAPPRTPLVPERSDFLEGDTPAAAKVEAFLARALEVTGGDAPTTAGALVPWICDALLSNHSVKAYGRDLMDFLRHMRAQGVDPLHVTADHVKCYKRALLEAGMKSATVARRLSVLRGTYHQLAAKGLIAWETAQDIGAVKAPAVQKNSTPSLTQRQAISLLEAIPTETLQGIRDLALMSVFFLTGCRVSAIVQACVGHLESDGVEHYLHVTEKRNKKRRKILLAEGVRHRAFCYHQKSAPLRLGCQGVPPGDSSWAPPNHSERSGLPIHSVKFIHRKETSGLAFSFCCFSWLRLAYFGWPTVTFPGSSSFLPLTFVPIGFSSCSCPPSWSYPSRFSSSVSDIASFMG
jgi:Phage integrase, N-terminal SAM-like domain